MTPFKLKCLNFVQKCFKISILSILVACISLTSFYAKAQAEPLLISVLAQGDAITDPSALLRYALPIDNDKIRQFQSAIEDIATQLRGKRWSAIAKDVKRAAFLLTTQQDKLLKTIPENKQAKALEIADTLKSELNELQKALEAKNKGKIDEIRTQILAQVTELEELMVQEFPFEVPAKYSNLPQLKGRATVDLETTQGNLTLIVDGYSAPLTAGNFIDLVQRGFYDGLPFLRSEDNFVLQTGDPTGEAVGFNDPKTGDYRAIPLEILVKGEKEPFYGETLEDLGIYLPDLALPFNAYGAVALARPSNDPNGGSSQFFFFKFDSELTPPGFNLMDGRYGVFGYLVKGREVLDKLTEKDKIISAKVVKGLENLQ